MTCEFIHLVSIKIPNTQEKPNDPRRNPKHRERERVTSYSLRNYFRKFLTYIKNKIFSTTEVAENAEIIPERKKRITTNIKQTVNENKNHKRSPRPHSTRFAAQCIALCTPWLNFVQSLLHDLSSGFKFGLGMLAAFFTAGLLAVAVTGVMNIFSDGEILSAGKLNTNFNTLKTAVEAIEKIPSGTIVAYGGTSAPAGWFLCDGTAVSQSTYSTLYTAIGCNFGCSGGNFYLPDLRGRFLRGRDAGSGRDPDSGSRTAMNTSGNTADNVGSVQGDDFKSHVHYTHLLGVGGAQTGGGQAYVIACSGLGCSTSPTGGSETRPVNAYVNFVIKY